MYTRLLLCLGFGFYKFCSILNLFKFFFWIRFNKHTNSLSFYFSFVVPQLERERVLHTRLSFIVTRQSWIPLFNHSFLRKTVLYLKHFSLLSPPSFPLPLRFLPLPRFRFAILFSSHCATHTLNTTTYATTTLLTQWSARRRSSITEATAETVAAAAAKEASTRK